MIPIGAALLASLLLTGAYFGIASLAGGPAHALDLFWQDRVLVIPILLAFGLQVGLWAVRRAGLHRPSRMPQAGAVTVAGGGISTVSMVACCAHHVTDLLPLVGLSAAAAFLANWKTPFMIAGLATNLLGILMQLRALLRERQARSGQVVNA